MKTITAVLCAMLVGAFPSLALAKVNAFACEPEWASLLNEVGGNKVSVYQATSPKQDPHHVQARPSLVAHMRRADIFVCTGSDLEIGWLPVLINSAGNRNVKLGTPGYFMASDFVKRLEVPTKVDRSMGDVHPYGNPHIQMDPRNIAIVANALAARLAEIDGENADYYKQQDAAFQKKWSEAIRRWDSEAAGLKGLRIVTYHSDAVYLASWLGLKLVTTIEPKPGIPPSAGHLSELLTELKAHPADLIVRMAYNDPKAPEWLSERTGIPEVELPFTVGGTAQASDLYGLFDDTIKLLNAATGH
jgi:zinc/manganese transport system substrate-binding protein